MVTRAVGTPRGTDSYGMWLCQRGNFDPATVDSHTKSELSMVGTRNADESAVAITFPW